MQPGEEFDLLGTGMNGAIGAVPDDAFGAVM